MNKPLLFINIITLVLVLLILAYLAEGSRARSNPEVIQLSDNSLLESSILQSQSETIKQNKILTERILVLEHKLNIFLSDLDRRDSEIAKTTVIESSPRSVVEPSAPVLLDQDLLDEAETLATSILSSGVLTVEQSNMLMSTLVNINGSPQAEMLRRKIIVSINNDELIVEPGAFF